MLSMAGKTSSMLFVTGGHCWPAGVEIAKALQLNYAFFCEFEELESPKRSPETQASRVLAMTMFADWVSCNVRAGLLLL